MRTFTPIALSLTLLSAPAVAADMDKCGDIPQLPEMFDVETAEVADIKRIATEYKAYQDANTGYIDCLQDFSKSDDIQGMKKKERKAAMNELDARLQKTIDNEQNFAEAFNANFTTWKEKKMASK